MDSFAEISVNFGTSPFLFDIIEFENKQIEKRHRIATTDVPETETAYESSTPRGLNWAFESFYREEISLADELVSGAASIEMLRDYYSHAAYHEERIVWRPNMLTSVDLSRAENLMLQCNQLLSDKAGLGFVMHELIDVLTPSRMQAYISRINSTQPNTTEFLMNFLVQGILPENLHNEPVDIFNPIYSDSESDSDYEYMEVILFCWRIAFSLLLNGLLYVHFLNSFLRMMIQIIFPYWEAMMRITRWPPAVATAYTLSMSLLNNFLAPICSCM